VHAVWSAALLASAWGAAVTIDGGEFTPLYGSQKKQVRVQTFALDRFPVTNAEFLAFVREQPRWRKSKATRIFVDRTYLEHWRGDVELGKRAPPGAPVVSVSWYAAKAYCESRGKGARLPTVDEWEFVASRPIPGHEVKRVILDWYSVPTPPILPPVSSALVNSTGVAAMHGLIWEWTLDFNSAMVTGESRGDSALDKSLYCGAGSMGAADATDYAAFLRFGMRSSLKANYTVANLGFRCAQDRVATPNETETTL